VALVRAIHCGYTGAMPREWDASTSRAMRPGAHWAMFLDLDGTLFDIAPTPQEVVAPEGIGQTLSRLQRALSGALAILSGRTIADIDRLLPSPRLAAAGEHGAELRLAPAEAIESTGLSVLPAWRERLRALARRHAGVLVEDKGHTVAVHYRNAPAAQRRIARELADLVAQDRRFVVQAGKCVLELRPRGSDKGTALLRIMTASPFAGRTPVVLGDDVTDEAAFAAAIALGGRAVRVGPSVAGASASLSDPRAARDWLDACAEALAAEKART
jgi:trehalose 6-phosphate phosphatase